MNVGETSGTSSAPPLLAIRDLTVQFRTGSVWGTAVDEVSMDVEAGRTVAVIGESGSGKSAMARAVMGVLPESGSRITGGQVQLEGVDLLSLAYGDRQEVNGQRIGMIFQDAMSALNPVLSIGYQIGEACRVHLDMSRTRATERAVELLDQVGIPDAKRRVGNYPHQMSGGMLQRVMIAMALSCDPDLLIADEPTTALDVTIQAQILQLLEDLKRERNMGLILITHDLGVVAGVADDIIVMYAGRVVEQGPADDVYDRPEHPYTRALLASIPRPQQRGGDLPMIAGHPPELTSKPQGCNFRPRCPEAVEACWEEPEMFLVREGHNARCHLVGTKSAV